jgi:hypothetical protein
MFFQNAQPQKFRYHLGYFAIVLFGGLLWSLAGCSADYGNGTSDKTVTETVTATATPVTVTATVTVNNTVTVVQTVSATNTATSIATNTATATPTQTATATATATKTSVTVDSDLWAANATVPNALDFNARYCAGVQQAEVLGNCSAAGISYAAGQYVTKISDGGFSKGSFRFIYTGSTTTECELTLYHCQNPPAADLPDTGWNNFGIAGNVGKDTHKGGPFVICPAKDNGNCHIQIQFTPGKVPQPMGILPNGP